MLSARKEVREAENKPAWTAVRKLRVYDDRDKNTYEYEDTVHIIFEGMDPAFIMALCFTCMKRPHGIGVIIEISDHTRHFGGSWLSDVARSSIVTW
jgi:hypothetical protein